MLVRSLHLAIVGIGAVLAFKALDLASRGTLDLNIPTTAIAQEEASNADAAATEEPDASGDVVEGGQGVDAETPANQVDIGGSINQDAMLESERAVLERLAARRTQLEQREGDLDMRERLLEAAEQRLESRLAELKAIEERLAQRAEEEKTRKTATLESIVAMYENMKPKDAAEIFNTLDLGVLVEVVENMKPRTMSSVLAAMNADSAQRLTLALARRAKEDTDVNPLDELDAIGTGG